MDPFVVQDPRLPLSLGHRRRALSSLHESKQKKHPLTNNVIVLSRCSILRVGVDPGKENSCLNSSHDLFHSNKPIEEDEMNGFEIKTVLRKPEGKSTLLTSSDVKVQQAFLFRVV